MHGPNQTASMKHIHGPSFVYMLLATGIQQGLISKVSHQAQSAQSYLHAKSEALVCRDEAGRIDQ
jgi:hypothetical protein